MNFQLRRRALAASALWPLTLLGACASKPNPALLVPPLCGAEQVDLYAANLKGKRVGLVTNAGARLNGLSVMDRLKEQGIPTTLVLTPEHGYEATADAGEAVGRQTLDFPVFSLYGVHRRPPPEVMRQLDVVLFDLQDVGVRVYTYISTLHEVMEACAEAGVPLVVLDRPNPNGEFVDGPVLEPALRSFVGMHPIPFLHGLTVGELALMIQGEGWLTARQTLELSVVEVKHFRHSLAYTPPLPPSPNLPNRQAIRLYPSLVWFEATPVSIGRGTDFPFQVVGSTLNSADKFQFTPEPRVGAKTPPGMGKLHRGADLRLQRVQGLRLQWLLQWHKRYRQANRPFFTNAQFFDKLAGTYALRQDIEAGQSESDIRERWKPALDRYRALRERYALYP